MKSSDVIKRLFDVAVGGIVLVFSAPLQALVALIIRTRMGSPVFFSQPRPGKDAVIFQMRKFRTMLEVDQARNLVTDEQRMTPLGRILRSTSLDELPTLWNVVKGDMSLVGPRPLLVRYLDRYTPEQARRHEVRPGVTGLAQVSGRNSLSWDQKFAKDIEYVDNRNMLLDMKVIFWTVISVVRRDGISAAGEATMSEFAGNHEA